MADPTPEPRGTATPPTCEEFLQFVEEASTTKASRNHPVAAVVLCICGLLAVRYFSESAAIVLSFVLLVLSFIACFVLIVLCFWELMRLELNPARKYAGGLLDGHILGLGRCVVLDGTWQSAYGEVVVTPAFIALLKTGYRHPIPLYNTYARPLKNRVQCIPISRDTRVSFDDRLRKGRTMYYMGIQPGEFQGGDRVYLRPSEIRKLLPGLIRLGIAVAGPQDL